MGARDPVIVGIGWSDYPVAPELDAMEHHAHGAAPGAGRLGPREVRHRRVHVRGDRRSPTMSTTPPIWPSTSGSTTAGSTAPSVGGSTFEFYVQHAAAAIEAGMCDVVLVTYGSDMLSRMGRMLGHEHLLGRVRPGGWARPSSNAPGEMSWPVATPWRPAGTCTSSAPRPSSWPRSPWVYASTPALNPLAQYRDPITVDDVLGSRMIADPLHKLDCCVISDGGGAFLMTTRERARDLPKPPVFVLGAAGAQTHWTISQMPDFTTTAAAQCGPEAFGRAGVRPEEVDTIQCYDSFTITVLLLLEDMGFCQKGEGGAFVETGVLRRGGRQPTQHRRRRACRPATRACGASS